MASHGIPDDELIGYFESTEDLEPEEAEEERQTPVRPSEERRRGRQMGVTFSSEEIPDRLKDMASAWGMFALNGKPAVSALVEHLLMPRLEAAERGEIGPPKGNR